MLAKKPALIGAITRAATSGSAQVWLPLSENGSDVSIIVLVISFERGCG